MNAGVCEQINILGICCVNTKDTNIALRDNQVTSVFKHSFTIDGYYLYKKDKGGFDQQKHIVWQIPIRKLCTKKIMEGNSYL